MGDKDSVDLLIFGYASKIFSDDEKALHIHQGKHLIPWIGDNKILIDRYDFRGYISEIPKIKAPILSQEEAYIEKLCEQERYLALYKILTQENDNYNEELKKLHHEIAVDQSKYGQVGFKYEGDQKDEEEDQVFVPPENLYIPTGMQIPPTLKQNSIIEMTANFVVRQGFQMEIVMKAKQANNPLFAFMNLDNILYPYYKHLIKMIKEEHYIPKIAPPIKKEMSCQGQVSNESDSNDDSDDTGYLHPSLFKSAANTTSTSIDKNPVVKPPENNVENKEAGILPSVSSTENHPYSVLISKISQQNRLQKLKEGTSITPTDGSNDEDFIIDASEYQVLEPGKVDKQGDQKEISAKKNIQKLSFNEAYARYCELTPDTISPAIKDVITKFVKFVVKNGIVFENEVAAKPRFERLFFLRHHDHPFYPFYVYEMKHIYDYVKTAYLKHVKETQYLKFMGKDLKSKIAAAAGQHPSDQIRVNKPHHITQPMDPVQNIGENSANSENNNAFELNEPSEEISRNEFDSNVIGTPKVQTNSLINGKEPIPLSQDSNNDLESETLPTSLLNNSHKPLDKDSSLLNTSQPQESTLPQQNEAVVKSPETEDESNVQSEELIPHEQKFLNDLLKGLTNTSNIQDNQKIMDTETPSVMAECPFMFGIKLEERDLRVKESICWRLHFKPAIIGALRKKAEEESMARRKEYLNQIPNSSQYMKYKDLKNRHDPICFSIRSKEEQPLPFKQLTMLLYESPSSESASEGEENIQTTEEGSNLVGSNALMPDGVTEKEDSNLKVTSTCKFKTAGTTKISITNSEDQSNLMDFELIIENNPETLFSSLLSNNKTKRITQDFKAPIARPHIKMKGTDVSTSVKAERKKKAALFVKMLKHKDPSPPAHTFELSHQENSALHTIPEPHHNDSLANHLTDFYGRPENKVDIFGDETQTTSKKVSKKRFSSTSKHTKSLPLEEGEIELSSDSDGDQSKTAGNHQDSSEEIIIIDDEENLSPGKSVSQNRSEESKTRKKKRSRRHSRDRSKQKAHHKSSTHDRKRRKRRTDEPKDDKY